MLNSSAENSQFGATILLLLGSVFSFGLSEILKMAQVLQIIILMPLLDSSMPANTGMFFNVVSKIAAFDILDIEGVI